MRAHEETTTCDAAGVELWVKIYMQMGFLILHAQNVYTFSVLIGEWQAVSW